MGWRERYRQARFRSAQFYVNTADTEFGRRVIEHEFPGEDRPFTQDLGRSARRFSVEGYVLGDDYLLQRDALLKECEKEGPGELIHPYYGSLSVVCTKIRFRDIKAETRIGRFTITFVEANILLDIPSVNIDTYTNVLDKRRAAIQAVYNAFQNVYSIANKPYVIVKNVEGTINQAILQAETGRRIVNSVSNFQRTVENIKDRVATLVSLPGQLVEDLTSLFTFGTDPEDPDNPATTENAPIQFEELRDSFEFAPELELGDNEDPAFVTASAVQQLSVIACAGLVSIIEYDSLDEARKTRDVVVGKIDDLQKTIGIDDELFVALDELRDAVTRSIEEIAADLSRLTQFTPLQSTPALVLSNFLYGSVEFEQDIVLRNKIPHPGFVPGGVPAEVLAYAT